jgi:hypothetical protein
MQTKYATIEPHSWGCTVRFKGGSMCLAQNFPSDPHYRVISHRCGYQDDTLRYCIEHEIAHLVVEEWLFDRPSRVLTALAAGSPLEPHEAAYEEGMAQMLQRYARANEQPIIGGVDWLGMRERFIWCATHE